MMEDKRARRGEPVLVDGIKGTIEYGDDRGMSIYTEGHGRIVLHSRIDVEQRMRPDPGGARPCWDSLRKLT